MKRKKLVIKCTIVYLLLLSTESIAGDVITIPKGSGLVWQGYPFTANLNTRITNSRFTITDNMIGITAGVIIPGTGAGIYSTCMDPYQTRMIDGKMVFPLVPGLYITPVSNYSGNFINYYRQNVVFSGQLGANNNITQSYSYTPLIVNSDKPIRKFSWCVSPDSNGFDDIDNFYSKNAPSSVTISGYWEIIADGTQKQSEIKGLNIWAVKTSFFSSPDGYDRVQIFPDTVSFRISTLECNLVVDPLVDFGDVMHSKLPNKELGKVNKMLSAYCTQGEEPIDSSISLEFRAVSGLFKGEKTHLSLTQNSGYITGELQNTPNNVFSGECGGVSGIPFDITPISIGNISKSETSFNKSLPIIWRLCTSDTPDTDILNYGNVDASVEVILTLK